MARICNEASSNPTRRLLLAAETRGHLKIQNTNTSRQLPSQNLSIHLISHRSILAILFVST
eukprot:761146-Hanusia_phi.AAC.2